MFREFLTTCVALATLIIATAGTDVVASVTSPTFQSSRQSELARIEVPPQSHGYIMMAGTIVRDHRSNNSGTTGNWSGTNVTPPPVSPGYGEGGVGHSPWSNSRDHRRCHIVVNSFTGQTGTICGGGN
jgi:hypothetical protein